MKGVISVRSLEKKLFGIFLKYVFKNRISQRNIKLVAYQIMEGI